MGFREIRVGELMYMRADNIDAVHGFTTRYGGVSEGAYASLNLSFSSGDEAARVHENYRILGETVGIDVYHAGYTRQVHGNAVRIVTHEESGAPGDRVPEDSDAVVTNAEGLTVFCFTADCVPILMYEPLARVAAAAHCGWRGSVSDMVGATVAAMQSLGAQPEHIRAAIGPSISQCCFETEADVPEAVDKWLGESGKEFYVYDKSRKKYMVDIKGANVRRLLDLGLSAQHIEQSEECTMCLDEKYWSHRGAKGGARGTQAAFIVL